MNFYHGTTSHKADCIDSEGWLGSELSENTSLNRHVEGGVVYLASSIEEAAEYGDVVFEIHPVGIEIHPWTDGNSNHYYAMAEDVNSQAWWERV